MEIKIQGRALVVDVTVRCENSEYLRAMYLEKMDKYSHLPSLLQANMGVEMSAVVPIVVGTRGIFPADLSYYLVISLSKSLLIISLIAHRISLKIFHKFQEYDAPENQRHWRIRQ